MMIKHTHKHTRRLRMSCQSSSVSALLTDPSLLLIRRSVLYSACRHLLSVTVDQCHWTAHQWCISHTWTVSSEQKQRHNKNGFFSKSGALFFSQKSWRPFQSSPSEHRSWLFVTANAQNTLQHFQGRGASATPCPCHRAPLSTYNSTLQNTSIVNRSQNFLV